MTRLGVQLVLSAVFFSLSLSVPGFAKSKVKWPDCKCQNYGRYMLVGEVGCIRTNKGMRMARCILKGNVTYWEWLDDSCPVSKESVPNMSPAKLKIAS